MYQKKKKTVLKHFDFVLFDFLCIELSFLLAIAMRFGFDSWMNIPSGTGQMAPYGRIMMILLLIHLILVTFAEPYSNILKRNAAKEFLKVLVYNIYMFVGLIVILFTEQSSDDYSRIAVYVFLLFDIAIMFCYRYLYKLYLRRKINKEENQDCVLLVAPYSQIKSVLHRFNKREISTVKIVGIVLTDTMADLEVAAGTEVLKQIENEDSNLGDIPIVGTRENMFEYARTNVVDEVLICMENEGVEDIANQFISMGITVHVSIQNLVQIPRATVNRLNGIAVITASVNTVTTRQLVIKRLVDIFCGFCGTIATLLSMLVVVPMILIQDPGPIFFRQERVGKNGRTFKIWKFRTMYKDAEARKAELMAQNKMSGLMFKMDDDPRIIGYGKKFSVGKFLRESSLDELPQSFNILAGSMSVVGTRPPTVKEYEQYELHHKGRLATKPGLTGMWQVSGRSDITDFEEVVRLDKEYIDNFSLSLDLEIMLKTFKVVLGKEGSV